MPEKVNILTDIGSNIDAITVAVSQKLKNYRSRYKISLDELSRRSGVSKGMLVEIEKCAANPSISILCKIAATIGVSVADIVNVSKEPSTHVIQPADMPVLWHGKYGGSACLLAGTHGPNMIELWHWEMLPGETYESTGHSEETYEILYVDRGTLALTIDQTTFVVPAGCSAVAKTNVPHAYANLGEDSLKFTMTVAELQ